VLHNHQQPVERDEWIINHDMGVVPIVSVFVDRPLQDDPNNRDEITPTDIIIVSDNTVRLVFDRPWSGIAQLIARQSDPDLFNPKTRIIETEDPATQFSTTSEITIATRVGAFDPNNNIQLRVEYSTPANTTETLDYEIDTQPDILSPWVDYEDGIIIKGQIYTVRSFTAFAPEMSSGIIGSGSTFTFTKAADLGGSPVSLDDITPGDILILLADAPYQTVDKVLDQFIDVTSVSAEENVGGFYYNNGEFFAVSGIAQNIYPLIRSL
jgi:hypothetical protein